MMCKIAILTSGGDAPGMNAAIRAAQRSALHHNCKLFAVQDAFKGLVDGKIRPFSRDDVARIINRGGTILGSVRYPEFKRKDVQKLAAQRMKSFGIDKLIIIGGGGSFRGGRELVNDDIEVVGIPATIDNDVPSTDYAIGFHTAVNTAVQSIDRLRDTSDSHQRCSVVEVMGRDCGDLALFSGIASGSEIVVTPETGYDEAGIIENVKEAFKRNKRHAIVVITENMTDVGSLARKIEDRSGFETRATVLGHVQRGGSPDAFDRVLATRMAHQAVANLKHGQGSAVLGLKGNDIITHAFQDALDMEKEPLDEHFTLIRKLKE